MCGFSTPSNSPVLSWVSYKWTQVWHSLPGGSVKSQGWRAQSHKLLPLQTQVSACASDWPALNRRFSQPTPWVGSFARTAHRTQEDGLLISTADLLQRIFQRVQMNSQREEMHQVGMGGGPGLPCPLLAPASQHPPYYCPSGFLWRLHT